MAEAKSKAHDFSFTSIAGETLSLKQFEGRVLLVVNTASHCGFTPQYADLETLWRRYRDQGLTVLAVPSNDFGQQEPGSNDEIEKFCRDTYDVDFPLVAKEKVSGDDAHPFYQWAAAEGGADAAPRWNFHKYLIGPYGEFAGAFPSQVKPLDQSVTEAIDRLIQTSKP
jgi:glutathione peroxidase